MLTRKPIVSFDRFTVVRFKLFTLDHRFVRGELGKLSATDATAVRTELAHLLEGAP